MPKVYKVVDPLKPGSLHLHCVTVDWSKCILCKTSTSESLVCPADSKRANEGAGYKTTAENLLAFERLGCLPKTINLSQLDEGEGIEASFKHKAAWHDSCRLKFNKTKLKWVEKRKEAPNDSLTSDCHKTFARRSREQVSPSIHKCFF